MTATVVLFSLPLPLFLVFLLKVVVDLAKTKPKQGPYPPGPKQLPLIGNALDLQMKEDLGADYMKWSKKYNSRCDCLFKSIYSLICTGNILFATAFGRHVLIVNSLEDADELFERRAKIYSDRPQFPLINL